MNREIKFRVWENGGFWYFNIGDEITEAEGRIYQQFTGLKDPCGNEIYEGDIIKETYDRLRGYVANFDKSKTDTSDGLWTYGNFSYVSQVFWNEMYHGFGVNRYLDGRQDDAHMFPLNGDNVEVIGNIFQNKELLND